MKPFLLRWLITTIAVLVATTIIPGIEVSGSIALLGASLFLGILNALVRPILLLLSIPLILLTMGIFMLVINAFLLMMVNWIVPGFSIESFWSAILGALVVSISSWIMSAFFRDSHGNIQILTHHEQVKSGQMKQADAKVIDG